MVKRKYSAVTNGNLYAKAAPRKKMKIGYKKKLVKPVYKTKSVARKGVGSLVSKKHIKTGKRAPKVSARLTKSIRIIAQKEQLKDSPIYDCKEIFCGLIASPAFNVQASYDVYTSSGTSAGGFTSNTFNMLSKPEIATLLTKGWGVTTAAATPAKFNIMYMKKTWTITNNTFAHLDFTAIEWVANADTGDLPLVSWTSGLVNIPPITGLTNAVTQVGQRATDISSWRNLYKSKTTNFSLAPGTSYTHSLYCSNVDIDLEKWLLDYKKGISKGVMFTVANHQVGGGATALIAGLGNVATDSAQITIRNDCHCKITAPETTTEAEAFDKMFRNISAGTYVGPVVSVFDRSALALTAGT